MRNTPQKSPSESTQALLAKADNQSKRDRLKLILMTVGLIVVGGAYFMSNLQGRKQEDKQATLIGEGPEPDFVETTLVKTFDMATIADKILDNRPEDRVLLPTEITDPVTNYVTGMTDGQFHALGLSTLDGPLRTALEEAPAEHRGEAYRVRGKLEDIKSRKRPDGKTEFRGWLRDEDGNALHFISMATPEEMTLTGSVRMDGLFLKLHSAEGHEGEWVHGPLFIGARLVNSYAPYKAEDITPAQLMASLDRVKDDTALDSSGLSGPVFDAQWRLMEFAKSDAYKAIDWENDAVELTNDVMADILTEGTRWHYRTAGDKDPAQINDRRNELPVLAGDMVPIPIRLPISRNMGINTKDPGENPARLDTITEGWIGNMSWTNQAGVIYFLMGADRPDLTDRSAARLVQGRGFFIKNHNYMSKDKGTRTAPFFVFTEMELFTPVESRSAQDLMLVIMIVTLILIGAFPILLMRDRKKSKELHQDLVRRKQERRRRLATTDQ